MTDAELVARFLAEDVSAEAREDAFRSLVERHSGMVYQACLRGLEGDAARAEDAAQAVFIALARKAGTVRNKASLTGWLFGAARYSVSHIKREESRRRRREEKAARMAEYVEDENEWEQVRLYLDDAIGALCPKLREAVAMHFLEGKTPAQISGLLSCTENAARKRIKRGLGKMRSYLVKRGAAVSAVALAAVLGAKVAHAAPAGFTASCVSTALANASGPLVATAASSASISVTKGVLKMMMWTKIKMAVVSVMAAAVVTSGGVTAILKTQPEKAAPVFLPVPDNVDPRALASGLYIRARAPVKRTKVTFEVIEPSHIARERCPVRGSIPLYRGELQDPGKIRLQNDQGREIPVQGFATALWPEGTVKFLCIDFLIDLEAGQTKTYTLEYGTEVLEYGTEVKKDPRTSLRVKKYGEEIQIDTGLMQVTFSPGQQLCSTIKIKGKTITRGPVTGRLLVSEAKPLATPKTYPLIIEKVELVEEGPVQAIVYLRGSYGELKSATEFKWQKKKNAPRYLFHGFVRIYAGSGRMDLIHSFGYNGDENSDFVRRYGVVVPLALEEGTFIYGADKGTPQKVPVRGDLLLAQPGHSSWVLRGTTQAKGKRFGGWAAMEGDGISAVVGLRHAWQQWPVSFQANKRGELTLNIHGGLEETFLDLRYWTKDEQGNKVFGKSKSMYVGEKYGNSYGKATHRAMGLLKISEVVLDFTPGASPSSVGNGHHQMLLPWPGVKRFSDTRVFGLTGYYDDSPKLQRVKDYCSILLDFPLVLHDANGYYGWVDYPDVPDCKPPVDGKFDMKIFRGGTGWTNGERALMGYLGHYVASGWRRALDTGHQMVLHTIGIDIEHNGGDQNAGMPHRHDQVHWGEQGGLRQTGMRGWYMHYWLTGHNEVWRSLREEIHTVVYGVSNKQWKYACFWPHHIQQDPLSINLNEQDKVAYLDTSSTGAGAHHYPNLMRWQTTGESRFVRFNNLLMSWWAESKEFYSIGGRLEVGIEGQDLGVRAFSKGEKKLGSFLRGYWFTYGGDDLVSEWAQLSGSKEAVDLLLAVGDYYASEERAGNRIDIRHGPKPPRKEYPWQLYASPEGLAPAYYLLRRGSDPKRAGRWVSAMKWRMFEFPGYAPRGPSSSGSARCLPPGAHPLPLEEYTADKWYAFNVKCAGENGPKIAMAVGLEHIYTLWFVQNAR